MMTSGTFGFGSMWIILAVLPCLPLARTSGAQALELSGGVSSIYNAEGGTVLLHGRNTETFVGVGLANGRFAGSGGMERRLKNGVETLGLQTVRADIPTDVFNETHLLVGVGAGISLYEKSRDHSSLHTFAGFGSTDGGSPLFRSGSLEHLAAFMQWDREISKRCHAITTGSSVRQSIGFASIACLPTGSPAVRLAFTFGGGHSGLYSAASYSIERDNLHLRAAYIHQAKDLDRSTVSWAAMPEPVRENVSTEYRISRSWSVSGLRQHFVSAAYTDASAPDRNTPREETSLNQVGVQFHTHNGSMGVTFVQSGFRTGSLAATPLPEVFSDTNGPRTSSNTALAVSSERTIGRVRWSETCVQNKSDIESTTLLMSGLAIRINPHLLLSEVVDNSGGRTSFAHGGELVTAAASVRVDYELLYLANRPQQPFQQVMMVNAGTRLGRSVAAELGSTIGAAGKVGYTVKLTTYHARDGLPRREQVTSMGMNTVVGLVVDQAGAPIAGAALLIGSTHLYTDDSGFFLLRERRAAVHSLSVLTNEFLSLDLFSVVMAPSVVKSGPEMQVTPIRIVLAKCRANVTPRPASNAGGSGQPAPSPLPKPSPAI